MKKEVAESEKYYVFYEDGRHGPGVDKRKGTGKVLTYLIKHAGTLISLEAIEEVSGWDNPNKKMSEFIQEINAWSPYTIQKVGRGKESKYRLIKTE